jgi:hypothetical protein
VHFPRPLEQGVGGRDGDQRTQDAQQRVALAGACSVASSGPISSDLLRRCRVATR